jgi:hypothetical protein
MARYLSDVRLIYLLRHPIERAYSDYIQRVKIARNVSPDQVAALTQLSDEEREVLRCIQRADTDTGGDFQGARFEDIIEITDRVLDTGLYERQIAHYREHFFGDQMKIILFDDLCDRPDETCREVFAFLGVDPDFASAQDAAVKANVSRDHHRRTAKARIRSKIDAVPLVAQLKYVLPSGIRERIWRGFDWLGITGQAMKSVVPPPMSFQTRKRLVEFYRGSNDAVAGMLGRDLSHWNV